MVLTFDRVGLGQGRRRELSANPAFLLSEGALLPGAGLFFAPIVLVAFSMTCLAQENMSEVVFVAHELHLREKNGIGLKSWHGIHGRKGLAAAVTTSRNTCIVSQVYFGRESFGAGLLTTGTIDKRVGERWWVSFRAPAGYEICSASLDPESLLQNPSFRESKRNRNEHEYE